VRPWREPLSPLFHFRLFVARDATRWPRLQCRLFPFDKDKPSNRCVNLHREHPRPSLYESDFEKVQL
jgi:hypothetical protein